MEGQTVNGSAVVAVRVTVKSPGSAGLGTHRASTFALLVIAAHDPFAGSTGLVSASFSATKKSKLYPLSTALDVPVADDQCIISALEFAGAPIGGAGGRFVFPSTNGVRLPL